MMPHPLAEMFSGYIDGQASPEERRRLEDHLAECSACRAVLAGLRQTVAIAGGLDPVGPPAGFRAAVMETLARDARAGSPGVPARGWSARLRRPAWQTAVAAAAVLAVGLFSLNYLGLLGQGTEEPFAAGDVERQTPRALEAVERPNGAPGVGVQPVGVASRAQAPGAPGVTRLPLGRLIARSATLGLDVVTLPEGLTALSRIAEATGGFVSASSVAQTEPPSGTVLLRIPTFRFMEALEQIEALGKVTGRQVRQEDVTEEVADLRIRMRTLQGQERQLMPVAGQPGPSQDRLALEQELTRVRRELEVVGGRLALLADRVQMSSIQITLGEK